MSFNAKNTLLFGLLLLAAALAPVGISSKFYLDVLTLIFFTAYIGQSWNILGGMQVSFLLVVSCSLEPGRIHLPFFWSRLVFRRLLVFLWRF